MEFFFGIVRRAIIKIFSNNSNINCNHFHLVGADSLSKLRCCSRFNSILKLLKLNSKMFFIVLTLIIKCTLTKVPIF